mmetsp:Transcript_26372/g.60823  ORF Transcript_26372/g.60823 Transcript_26372/m.60823 type:complete len:435 (-) Transcript_26372:44-1348(-)
MAEVEQEVRSSALCTGEEDDIELEESAIDSKDQEDVDCDWVTVPYSRADDEEQDAEGTSYAAENAECVDASEERPQRDAPHRLQQWPVWKAALLSEGFGILAALAAASALRSIAPEQQSKRPGAGGDGAEQCTDPRLYEECHSADAVSAPLPELDDEVGRAEGTSADESVAPLDPQAQGGRPERSQTSVQHEGPSLHDATGTAAVDGEHRPSQVGDSVTCGSGPADVEGQRLVRWLVLGQLGTDRLLELINAWESQKGSSSILQQRERPYHDASYLRSLHRARKHSKGLNRKDRKGQSSSRRQVIPRDGFDLEVVQCHIPGYGDRHADVAHPAGRLERVQSFDWVAIVKAGKGARIASTKEVEMLSVCYTKQQRPMSSSVLLGDEHWNEFWEKVSKLLSPQLRCQPREAEQWQPLYNGCPYLRRTERVTLCSRL